MFQIKYTAEETNKVLTSRPSNQIFILNNILSEDVCEDISSYIDANVKVEEKSFNHETNVTAYGKVVSARDKHCNVIKSTLKNIAEHMYKKYAVETSCNSSITLRKIYGATKMHVDGPFNSGGEAGIQRMMAVIICLNDDYEGGELLFPCQNFKVKLKQGQAILFPPFWTHPHRTNDLKNNTFRYTITTWLCLH